MYEAGARGLVESARNRLLQRTTTRGAASRGAATAKPTSQKAAESEGLHPNAPLLPGIIGRIDESAVRLYEVAAEQGSAFAALRAGDAAFYGGIGARLHDLLQYLCGLCSRLSFPVFTVFRVQAQATNLQAKSRCSQCRALHSSTRWLRPLSARRW